MPYVYNSKCYLHDIKLDSTYGIYWQLKEMVHLRRKLMRVDF